MTKKTVMKTRTTTTTTIIAWMSYIILSLCQHQQQSPWMQRLAVAAFSPSQLPFKHPFDSTLSRFSQIELNRWTRNRWGNKKSTTSTSTTTFQRHAAIADDDDDEDIYANKSVDQQDDTNNKMLSSISSRRTFLSAMTLSLSAAAVASAAAVTFPLAAHARPGLVQFPCINTDGENTLVNTYIFMRSGTSLLEEQDIWSTNPLFLTNREDALSEAGQEQVRAACQTMAQQNLTPSIVKYSLAASCMDTANIVGQELLVGRDRLVPEFTFLDPRAIGRWDMLSRATTLPAVMSLDVDFAGTYGDAVESRPPPNDNGTPHEVLADQAVRLRQLLSILESQYSGDTILLIFPDGTGPAVLSCLMAGLPLNRAHELEFSNGGDIRLNVTYHTTRALWQERQNDAAFQTNYQTMLQQGRQTLAELKLKEPNDIVNIRDQQIEQERIDIEAQMAEKEERRRKVEEEADRQRLERQRQLNAAAASSSSSSSAVSTKALGAAVVLAAIGASTTTAQQQQQQRQQETAMNEGDGSVLASGFSTETDTSQSSGGGLNGSTATIARPQMINGDRKNSTMLISNNQDDDVSSPTTSIATITDPYERAEQAMEEYLSQDDGGEAWIESLAQLIDDEDDDINNAGGSDTFDDMRQQD